MIGFGERMRLDPGTGPDRYANALAALRHSGSELALASFTFDVAVGGSVVVVPEDVIERADGHTTKDGPLPAGHIVSDGADSWREGMNGALASLGAGLVEKVVLARQVDIEFDGDVPLDRIIDSLRRDQPDCYTFLVDGLIGASPELLVSLQNGTISSLALAGTAPNAESLWSSKMDREHLFAATSVEAGISRHVTKLEVPTRTILEFGEIKHLATRFEGSAVSGATVLEVLGSLHPTASVAGAPTPAALSLIKELEPRSRTRFAGPVGWFNSDGEGEFAIALRCGLVRGRKATLYAGGGIVNGSDADSEFAETELKLRPMLAALGLQ